MNALIRRPAVALSLLIVCSPLCAAVNRWTSVGPSGGFVRSIVVHPTDPATAWAALQPGGVFRTRDRGASWQKLPAGPDQGFGSSASLIAVDSGSPAFLLSNVSGTNGALSRSTDGGDSWSPVGRPGTNGSILALAIARGTPSRLFASTTNGLFRSTDGGSSWTLIFGVPFQGPGSGVLSVMVDPSNPDVVYASAGVSGFIKSTDGGLTFTTRAGPAFARSIAIHPTQTQILYAATPGLGVSRSSDGGATWTAMNLGLTDTNTRSIAIDPAFPSRIWVATDGSGVFRSSNDAGSWTPAGSGLTNPFANAVAFGSGGAMGLVGYTGAGISRTVDHGTSWSETPLPAAYVQKLAAGAGGPLLAGVYGVGVARTSDHGKSWSIGSAGLARPDFGDLAVSRRDSRYMAVGTFGAIFSSQDGGSTWTTHELRDSNCLSLAFDPLDARTIYAALITSEILRSQDGGLTWSKVSDFVSALTPSNYATLLRADPGRAGVLFANAEYSGLLRSADAGQSWTSVAPFDGLPFVALEFDVSDSSHVYASDGFSFFRSSDRGLSWSRGGTLPGGGLITSLSSDPRSSGSLYAGVNGAGVFRTTDFGATWTPINDGLSIYAVSAIQVDPQDPSWVYAATNGAGIFAMQQSGTPCVSDGATLCLNGDRFRVRSSWRVPSQGTSGSGTSVRLTADTGYFWFFSSNNVELVVKVVDGTPVNGKYWVFSGALSDVEYTITVTDTISGETKSYLNPSGSLASFADTSAF